MAAEHGDPAPLVAHLVEDTVDESAVERIRHGVAARRRQPARRSREGFRSLALAAAAVLLAVTCAVAAFWAGSRHRTGTTSDPGPLTLEGGAPFSEIAVEGAARDAERFDLSDGSWVELWPATTLRATTNDGRRVALRLRAGRATFDVAPGGPRRWSVDAGLARVEVLGTSFTVESSPTRVAIEVDRGRVRVLSRRLPGGSRDLSAGESLVVEAEAREPPASSASDAGAGRGQGGDADAARSGGGWQALARHGDYGQAYAMLGPAGLEQQTRQAETMDELMTLADVARLSGHPQDAVLPLEIAIEQHPSDPTAAVAAFTLGRVEGDELGRHGRAARAFARCLELQAPRALRENAYARLAEAHARSGDFEAARRAARDYLRQYPDGRRAAELQRWLESR